MVPTPQRSVHMTRIRVDVDTRRAANDDPEVMSLGHPEDGAEAVDLR